MEEDLRFGVFVENGPPNSCGLGSETILLRSTATRNATVRYVVRGVLAGIIDNKTVTVPAGQTISSGYCTYATIGGAKQGVSVQIVQVTLI